MLAYPADGQKPGWVDEFGTDGFSMRACLCSSNRQSTFVRVVNPSECEVCFWNAQGDVMAARVVGIQQEGETLPDGAVHEGRGTRAAAMTSRERCNVREP